MWSNKIYIKLYAEIIKYIKITHFLYFVQKSTLFASILQGSKLCDLGFEMYLLYLKYISIYVQAYIFLIWNIQICMTFRVLLYTHKVPYIKFCNQSHGLRCMISASYDLKKNKKILENEVSSDVPITTDEDHFPSTNNYIIKWHEHSD